MITIMYSTKAGPGIPMSRQVAEMAAVNLTTEGELQLLFLSLSSDTTAWNSTTERIERTIEITESADFLSSIVGPGGDQDEKRRAAVRHLFDNKIALQIRKPVEEAITLR
jgi:uncharacterized protein (DUF1800 family)